MVLFTSVAQIKISEWTPVCFITRYKPLTEALKIKTCELFPDYECRTCSRGFFTAAAVLRSMDDELLQQRFDISTEDVWSRDLFKYDGTEIQKVRVWVITLPLSLDKLQTALFGLDAEIWELKALCDCLSHCVTQFGVFTTTKRTNCTTGMC